MTHRRRAEVTTCSGCPLADTYWMVCGHPEAPPGDERSLVGGPLLDGYLDDETGQWVETKGPPDWCPLREAPLVVSLTGPR